MGGSGGGAAVRRISSRVDGIDEACVISGVVECYLGVMSEDEGEGGVVIAPTLVEKEPFDVVNVAGNTGGKIRVSNDGAWDWDAMDIEPVLDSLVIFGYSLEEAGLLLWGQIFRDGCEGGQDSIPAAVEELEGVVFGRVNEGASKLDALGILCGDKGEDLDESPVSQANLGALDGNAEVLVDWPCGACVESVEARFIFDISEDSGDQLGSKAAMGRMIMVIGPIAKESWYMGDGDMGVTIGRHESEGICWGGRREVVLGAQILEGVGGGEGRPRMLDAGERVEDGRVGLICWDYAVLGDHPFVIGVVRVGGSWLGALLFEAYCYVMHGDWNGRAVMGMEAFDQRFDVRGGGFDSGSRWSKLANLLSGGAAICIDANGRGRCGRWEICSVGGVAGGACREGWRRIGIILEVKFRRAF
jgi:hypothetical protein